MAVVQTLSPTPEAISTFYAGIYVPVSTDVNGSPSDTLLTTKNAKVRERVYHWKMNFPLVIIPFLFSRNLAYFVVSFFFLILLAQDRIKGRMENSPSSVEGYSAEFIEVGGRGSLAA